MTEKSFTVAYEAPRFLCVKASQLRLASRGGRVLLWSWWLLSLVVAAAYSGTLTAFLSVTTQPRLFSSPQDLLTKQHDYTWGTLGDSGVLLMFQANNQTVYRQLLMGMERQFATDPDVLSTDMATLWAKVRSENFVLFFNERLVFDTFGSDCTMEVVDAQMQVATESFVLPKGSALTRPISDVILRLHSTGLLAHWIDQWFPQASCPPPSSDPVVISLLHLQDVLVMLATGAGLALLVLVVERITIM